LSDTKVGVDEAKFITIVEHLFKLIEKDRQTIGLVDKLCQRFRTTTNETQWYELAFSLNLLTYHDRSIAKLYENLSCFADKLSNDKVYECIMNILNTFKKTPQIRPDVKQLVEEFESKVEECRLKGVNHGDESEVQKIVGTPKTPVQSRNTSRLSQEAKKTTQKKKPPPKKSKKVSESEDEPDDSDEEQDFVPKEKPNAKRGERRVRRQRVQQMFADSDSNSDDDD